MRRLLACGLVVSLIVVGCSSSVSSDTGFELTEFTISGPGRVSEGPTTLEAFNSGEFGHTMVLTTRDGAVVAATEFIPPGATATLQAELAPGIYQITCRIVTEVDGGEFIDHYERGMNHMLVVES